MIVSPSYIFVYADLQYVTPEIYIVKKIFNKIPTVFVRWVVSLCSQPCKDETPILFYFLLVLKRLCPQSLAYNIFQFIVLPCPIFYLINSTLYYLNIIEKQFLHK